MFSLIKIKYNIHFLKNFILENESDQTFKLSRNRIVSSSSPRVFQKYSNPILSSLVFFKLKLKTNRSLFELEHRVVEAHNGFRGRSGISKAPKPISTSIK